MGKKLKHQAPHQLGSAGLRARVDVAVAEGRFQTALELGKQLHKQEPTTEHRDLLQHIYLGRARQLREQGKSRDAATVLRVALPLIGEDAAKLTRVAEELAACGELAQATELLQRLADASVQTRVLGQAVDFAIRQGAAGRKLLPPELHADFDGILRAFAQLEAGQDDAARETLQGISLQSPFLEWKVLLRGLLAYYQSDEARALENWQRLNPDRLPARLMAALRFTIDPAYRNAQPADAQAALQKHASRLQGASLVDRLRELNKQLESDEPLRRVFRVAEPLVAQLRQQAPHLVPRLGNLLQWAIIHSGQPEDIGTYARVFGVPLDDPSLIRLAALGLEQRAQFQDAQQCWQDFERAVAAHPEAWPAGQAQRIRALVWCHMGQNAALIPTADQLAKLPPLLQNIPGRPQPLKPAAEKCFQRAIELAPDLEDAYASLVSVYQRQQQDAKAEQIARRYLERRPDHLPTLKTLADLCMRQRNFGEAVAFLERAVQVNPLDPRLRENLASAHLFHARSFTEAGEFDTARAKFQVCLALNAEQTGKDTIFCKWAACEFKAGNPTRAEELLQEAIQHAPSRLAVAYNMLIEIIRLKLPRALKNRFDREFTTGLAEPPTGAAAAELASIAGSHRQAQVNYPAQKTHEKKVFAYLEKARKAEFTEKQLVETSEWLLRLERWRTLQAPT